MFIVSQYLLHKTNVCSTDNISTYAIASGLVIYASIYLYLLFYNNEYLSLFNKFIIYIIGIDLLLSTFYVFNSTKPNSLQIESNHPNVYVINQNEQNESDSDSLNDENDEDSDFEVESDDQIDIEMETIDPIHTHEINQEENNQEENTEQENTEQENNQKENTEQEITQNETTNELQQNEVQEQKNDQSQVSVNDIEKSLEIDTSNEPVVKKRRGRKPNHLKMQMS
jgi:hypothetical protein